MTVTNRMQLFEKRILEEFYPRNFISFEPLLEDIFPFPESNNYSLDKVAQIIIGAQTNPSKLPEKVWVDKIIQKAQQKSCKIFLKDNLKPLFSKNLIQELC
jgi:protein gp37